MFLNLSDDRIPLAPNSVVEVSPSKRFIIDKLLASGGFALMYLAHLEGTNRYVALKELYPRSIESTIIQRLDEGRIVAVRPFASRDDKEDDTMWSKLKEYFVREANLTRRAGEVYSQTGKREKQNNLDVLQVDGPMTDSRGNVYLAVDTYAGESLRDYIERGFIRNEDGSVGSNQFLANIIDIVLDITIRLSSLHGKEQLLHLDLSPDNVYLALSAGQTRYQPYIIDYGSAFDRNNPNEQVDHRYTVNPHSAPEIHALSEFQDPDCGYTADESSDTYSLASVLFYAATGRVFTSEMRVFGAEWKEQIRKEYSAGLPSHPGASSFASALISFFEQGLAASQTERYRSAEELNAALRSLKQRYQEYGNLLPLIPKDELASYMILEKYPLYQYKGPDGNIHVMCFGFGKFVRQMLLALISAGQMSDSKLIVHIVSSEPESLVWDYLRTAAPALPNYSNIDGPSGYEYVSFTYDCLSDVTNESECAGVLKKYGEAHYYLISLGRNNLNSEMAMLCSRLLAVQYAKRNKTIINFYCSEDLASNKFEIDKTYLPDWLQIEAFADALPSYTKTIRNLGVRTLKLAHLYNRLANPRISLAESARELAKDEYNQRSSCAAALHLKYKLASIGINPARSTNIRAIISAYQKALKTDKRDVLIELEHRRWMMFMVALGYREPTLVELRRYGFNYLEDGTFNAAWKCKEKKLHPCIAPSSTAGLSISATDWETLTSVEEIEKSTLDQLDQMSLKLHLIARRKCQSYIPTIESLFREIDRKLRDSEEDYRFDNGNTGEYSSYSSARKVLQEVSHGICECISKFDYPECAAQLPMIAQIFAELEINAIKEVSEIEQLLAVFAEYSACKDYKKSDETIIDNLLWVLYSKNELPMIKLKGRTIADNIAGPIIWEPDTLIYFGFEINQNWLDFFRNHGFTGEISFSNYIGSNLNEIERSLSRVVEQCRKCCVIDITGADEQLVIAAYKIASKYGNVSLIRSTQGGKIENIHNCTISAVYALNTSLAASEIYSLHGAKKKETGAGIYMSQLVDVVPQMWKFYREYQNSWEMITAFVAHRATNGAGAWFSDYVIDDNTQWVPFWNDFVAWTHWEKLCLTDVFIELTNAGIIRHLSIDTVAGKAVVSFMCPQNNKMARPEAVKKALTSLLGFKVPIAYSPFKCVIYKDQARGFSVDIKSDCLVDYYNKSTDFADKRNYSEKRYELADMEQPLKRMEELGLIYNLEFLMSGDYRGNSVKFVYSHPAIKECLATAGNILELYVWSEAEKTHVFNDCDSNFSFTWGVSNSDKDVSNELDVILTYGLSALVISCKTAKFNKEHLYEIKYLTERFSLQSKPVIVYSSNMAIEDGRLVTDLSAVKNRAVAMGVHLIDLNELETMDRSLGEELVRIANE